MYSSCIPSRSVCHDEAHEPHNNMNYKFFFTGDISCPYHLAGPLQEKLKAESQQHHLCLSGTCKPRSEVDDTLRCFD